MPAKTGVANCRSGRADSPNQPIIPSGPKGDFRPPRGRALTMLRRSNETLTMYGAIVASVLWTVGLVLAFLTASTDEVGMLFIIAAALTTVLLVMRRWMLRVRRAWMHGYHAGYHAALDVGAECRVGEDCAVLELAEVREKKLDQLA